MMIDMPGLVASPTATSQREIQIDGTALAGDIDAQIDRVVVTNRLTMADMFVIAFRDPEKEILKRAGCDIGKRVTISSGATTQDAPAILIDGEITSIEADYDHLGARAMVRGYDYSHRMTAGRRSRVFKNAKYSDIARAIATEAGLDADVDESIGTHEYVAQANLSDLDFLRGLAKQINYDCRVEGKTLSFKPKRKALTGPEPGDYMSAGSLQLVWNVNLLEFRGRISAVSQVSQVTVRGWDVEKKKPIIGKADGAATNASLPLKVPDLAGRVGKRTMTVVDRPVASQVEADSLAAAKAEQVGSAAFEASLVALGSADLKAGVAISVSGVDAALVGKWVITTSRHEFGDGSYHSHLECTGSQDRSLHGVVANGRPGAAANVDRITGLVVATVEENADPLKRGRVRLKFPWLADDFVSNWARVAAPGVGPNAGLVWLPEVGDEVLVGFEHGDISYPYVLGGLWNGQDLAPLGQDLHDAGNVTRSGFVSRQGHKLVFFDGPKKTGIALISAHDRYVISLNETENELHIKAAGHLKIEAETLEIKVSGDAKIQASGGLDLKSTATTTIQGSLVKIN